MRRFVFPLTRLERLREVQRTQARAGLAGAIGEVRGWHARAEAEREHLVRPLPVDDEMTANSEALKADAEWRAGRRALVRDARQHESVAKDELRRHQQDYARAARDHRVVERLREKRFERWRLEAERDERAFLDEIHLLRLLRGRRDASVSPEESE